MNEGITKYYRIGQRSTRFAYRSFKNLLNYYAFLIMEVIACITIIPIPILILAKVQMAKRIKYEQNINSISIFSIQNKKGFKQLWLAILLLLLHYLSRVLLIFLAGGFCFLIGLTISYYINQGGSSVTKELVSYIIICILTLPATIVYLAYTVYFALSIAPISFVIASSENMTVTQAIQCSFQAMKQAKGTLFLMSLVYSLISLVTIGIVSSGIMVCIIFIKSYYIQLIICILISLIGFYVISRFMMSSMVARYSLFEDLVRNTATEKNINHIKFSRYKGNYKSAEKNKLQMFDDLSTFDGQKNQLQETPSAALTASNQKPTPVVEKPQETPQEEPTPVAEPQEVQQEEPTPVVEPQVVQQEKITPVVEPQEVQQEEPTPMVEPQVVQQEEVTLVIEAQEVQQEEPTPMVEPQEVQQEKPTPVVEPQEVQQEEPTPVVEPQEVQQEEPTPVAEPQEVQQEEPKPVVEPQEVQQEAPAPADEPQEEVVKPKRGRKPKTVTIEEQSDTPKKTVKKTSTRTKKSKVDDENPSNTSTDDTKEDN